MENEELFAGESALDVQHATENLVQETRRTADGTILSVHHEPLLVNNDVDDEWPEDVQQLRDADTRPQWRRPSIFWLLPFALVFTIGFGGLAVPKVTLMRDLVCRNYLYERSLKDPNFTYLPVIVSGDNPQCKIPEVQSKVAQLQLYINLISGLVAALVSPRLGRLSDAYGRTKLIALSGTCAALSELITCFLGTWPESLSVYLFLFGALVDGLGGSITGAQVVLHSYATDCTTPDRRSMAFGLFHAALFLGVAAGPSGAALIISKTGSSLIVFYTGFLLHVFFSLSVLFIVPESLSKELQLVARAKHRVKPTDDEPKWYSWKALNPMNLVAPLKILWPAVGRPSALFANRKGASPALRRNILMLAVMDVALFGVAMGTVQVIIIYAEYMFDWGNVEMSLYIAVVNGLRTANLFLILPLVSWLFRTPTPNDGKIRGSDMLDVMIIRISVLFDVLGYIGYTLSKTGTTWLASGIVACLGGMGPPTIQSALTKHVPHDRVGQLLGATGLLHALARVVAPTIFNLIYSLTVGSYPQTVFMLLASVFGAAGFLSLFLRPHVSLDDEPELDIAVEANEDGEGEEDQLLLR
ncbi:hypothetical protein N7513_009360 [Penicillium frequentans]|uniref:Major facilitator superfamily (MFS) profile domain-containing protein n=1 Tax=Penicillium frequentans TaxID=3151616 RepID=A0AAD6G8P2_9EURO|nr:hypothetical protein N7494_010891 [Penicillium glabrum]KAJ5536174.1 hypothetical protein N7513_009360 [Penicillium glabrum]